MRIKSIVLNNFMNHVNSVIEISELLTCIVGKNDSGKSVIIHAIKWFSSNEPKGSIVISKFNGKMANKCSVTLITEDDTEFIKERSSNGTTLFKVPSWNKVWAKNELPSEIADILQIYSYDFGSIIYDLNFSFQLDAPFLISEAPSVGASVISKFAGTDILDLTSKSLEKDNYSINREINTIQEEIKSSKSELLSYSFVEKSKKDLENLTNKLMRVVDLKLTFQNLLIFAIKNDTINEDIKKCSANIKCLKAINYKESIKYLDNFNNKLISLNRLKDIVTKLSNGYLLLNSNEIKLDIIKAINFKKFKNKLDKISLSSLKYLKKCFSAYLDLDSRIGKITTDLVIFNEYSNKVKNFSSLSMLDVELSELNKLFSKFTYLKDSLSSCSKELDLTNSKINIKKQELDEVWNKVGYVCPTCDTILTKKGD